MGAKMTYQEFLEQTALEVWWMWNAGEVRWRNAIPQESKAYDYGVSTWSLGCDVWDRVEAKYGKYGSKL